MTSSGTLKEWGRRLNAARRELESVQGEMRADGLMVAPLTEALADLDDAHVSLAGWLGARMLKEQSDAEARVLDRGPGVHVVES